MRLNILFGCLAILPVPSFAVPSSTPNTTESSFTYNATTFLLNGAPYQIIGGQMDPQRIPAPYWRDRLRKVRAMGLNTIFTYTFWNLLEPGQGHWDDAEGKGIAKFFEIAQEEGLHVVLRPGPYICGEREWGGLPAWLANIPGMVVRSNNKPFLDAAENYLDNLATALRGLHIKEGGPILMVQVENEYGSYGEDHNYTSAVKDILQKTFGDVVLYTNDGTEQWTLDGGSVPGVLAEVDGDPHAGFAALRTYITDPSKKGPLLDGEYYTWTFDSWGYNRSTPPIDSFVADLDYVLGNESASISLYMVHGGTNFGFSNGALWQNKTRPFTTSYDYGAPIDEAGHTTPLYHALRAAILKYVPKGSVPDVPEDIPLSEIPAFDLKPAARLFHTDALGPKVDSKSPLEMEALNQSYGFVLYEHIYTSSTNASLSGALRPGDRARDRVIVYIDDAFVGVIDSTYAEPPPVTVALRPGAKVQLLVENLGRVDYFSRASQLANKVLDPWKGIRGVVTVGNVALENWVQRGIPLDTLPSDLHTYADAEVQGEDDVDQPRFYVATFPTPNANATLSEEQTSAALALDTYLALPAGVKGNVWVNGFHLGRYWERGPQTALYLPGSVLRVNGGTNEVVVLELEPGRVKGNMTAVGTRDRAWDVRVDADCVGCPLSR